MTLAELLHMAETNAVAFRASHGEPGIKLFDDLLDSTEVTLRVAHSHVVKTAATIEGVDHTLEETLIFMLHNCATDLYSVFISLQFGFIRPAGMAIRGAIENLLLASVIYKDPDAYVKYRSNRLKLEDSQKRIGPEFQALRKVWGKISGMYVHERFDSVGRSLVVKDDDVYLPAIPVINEKTIREIDKLLALLSETMFVIQDMARIIFPNADWKSIR